MIDHRVIIFRWRRYSLATCDVISVHVEADDWHLSDVGGLMIRYETVGNFLVPLRSICLYYTML